MQRSAFWKAILLACTISASRLGWERRAPRARVLTPADGDAYLRALSTINRFCPVRCASEIVQPSSTEELAEWLRSNKDKKFTVKGGGHSYGCQSVPRDGGTMIHTGRLNDARVFQRPDGTAFLRTGPGLSFAEVIPRLAKMGYSVPHGECLTVGMGGWTLNVGQHPELKNFENPWGYNDKPYLTKVTMVDYSGTIFYVDKDGLHLVRLGASSWLDWKSKVYRMERAGAAVELIQGIIEDKALVSVSKEMRILKLWGASLAIATQFEMELIPKPEPAFFAVTYSINDVLDESGKGKQLMQALFDVVSKAGRDPDLDCGLFYASHYFKGTLEGALNLKCVDWASATGANVKRMAPPGYRSFEPKASGFLFWSVDSYGKGWVPVFHAESEDKFIRVGGPEKYRDYLRALEHGDASGPNPCDACTSELMWVLIETEPNIMFDNLCSGSLVNQNKCSAFVLRIKEAFLGKRDIIYKQNLPSCAANSRWTKEVAEYRNGAHILARKLKRFWDPESKVDFWLGVGHDNSKECDAVKTQEVGATCRQHGITPHDLVQVELEYVRKFCPEFDNYKDFDTQNNECTAHVYNTSAPLPFSVLQ